MKEGWEIKVLSDVATIQSGAGFPKEFQGKTDQSFPFYKVSDMNISGNNREMVYSNNTVSEKVRGQLRANIFPKGSTIFPKIGGAIATNKKRLTTQDCCVDNNVMGVIPKKQCIESEFLFFFFLAHDLSEFANKAALPSIKKTTVEEWAIVLPSLPEQQRIVAILDEALEGIATAKANAEKNLENARALFESHLQSVFTQRGEGWEMTKLSELTDLSRGHNPPKSTFSPEAKPGYVRFYQIRDGSTDKHAVYVPDTPQLHKVKPEDILMIAYRHIGRVFKGVEGAFNVALCKVSNSRRDLLDDDFLYYILPSPFVKGELMKRSERSLIPSMSINHLKEIKIPLPKIVEQKKIGSLFNFLRKETQRLESIYQRKVAALDELKKSLLNEAFSGKL